MATATIDKSELIEHEVHEFSPKKNKHAIVVIIWNEGDKIRRQLEKMQDSCKNIDIILSDGDSSDGSTDHDYLKSMGVRTIVVNKEPGLGSAIRSGLAYVLEQGYEGILTCDGNGKDGVESIPDMQALLEEGYDFVQASRFMKGGFHKNTPLQRELGIKLILIPLLFIGCGFHFTDPTNGFKAMSREYLMDPLMQPLRGIFQKFNMQYYLNYRAPRLGYKVTELPVVRVYPDDGSIPTKIHGLAPKLRIIWELIECILGWYNPKK